MSTRGVLYGLYSVWCCMAVLPYSAVWCCMAVWRREGSVTMRDGCMAPYSCMVCCMAFLLYGTKYSTHHKHCTTRM